MEAIGVIGVGQIVQHNSIRGYYKIVVFLNVEVLRYYNIGQKYLRIGCGATSKISFNIHVVQHQGLVSIFT